jgi:hypothetical protein
MSSTNESNNSNLFKYITFALVAVILVGGGYFFFKNSSALNEKGKKSEAVYKKYMQQSTEARLIANHVRKGGEEIQKNIRKEKATVVEFDFKKLLNIVATYQGNAATADAGLDLRDVDSDLIDYIMKSRQIDLGLKKIYDDFASLGQKNTEDLSTLNNKQNLLAEREEQALLSKFKSVYGITLNSSSWYKEESEKALTSAGNAFIGTLNPANVASQLIGRNFINHPNGSKWTLGPAEYVLGQFIYKTGKNGVVMIGLSIEVKNPKNNNTGLLKAVVLYVKPSDETNLEWPMVFYSPI